MTTYGKRDAPREPTMKVVILITDTRRGGAPNSAAELAVGAREHGVDVAVVSMLPGGPVLSQLANLSFVTHSLGMGSWRDSGAGVMRLRRILKQEEPDVLQTVLWHANVLGRTVVRKGHPPVVDCYQSVDDQKSRFRVLLDRWTAHRASAHICVSHLVAERARSRERLEPQKITVVHVGKEIDRWASRGRGEEVRSRLGIPNDVAVVGWTGRMHPVKNLVALVRAVAAMPDTWLLLVGDGEERERVAATCAEAGIQRRAIITGEVVDVGPYLEAMNVFCLPSLWEGSSGALVEAMACGRTVVATAVGGNPEIITDGVDGILVDTSSDGIRQGILQGLTHPTGARAAQAVRERFSLSRMVGQYLDVWERVATTSMG